MAIADAGIAALKERVDSLIIVPNEKLLEVLGQDDYQCSMPLRTG